MESPRDLPESSLTVPDVMVFQVFEDNENFHHLILNGRDTGRIDWEESTDGREGYIDGLDAEAELNSLPYKDIAWLAIAACMHEHHPSVRRIVHVDGDSDRIIELTDN